MRHIKTYRCWSDMKRRCDNPKQKFYQNYGGRGISYDQRWKVFPNFLKDMGEKPEGMSLDRKNNNRNYSKKNCRWATWAEQNRNTTRNVVYKGECAKDASRRLGGGENLVVNRINRLKWPIRKAFTIKI